MSGIQVLKTESGWQITKDDKTFSVDDTNKNGRWDDDELIKSLSGSGYLSAEESYEAKYQIAQMSDGVTAAEMAQYEKYQKQKEEINSQQNNTNNTQKGKFWRGLAIGLTALTPLMSSITGMLAGWNLGNWSYNYGNSNDSMLRLSGAITGGLFGMSSTLPLVAGLLINNTTTPQASIYNTNNYNSFGTMGLSNAITAQNNYFQAMQEKMEKEAEEAKEKQEAKLKKQKEEENRAYINDVIEKVMPKTAIINDENKEYIKSLLDLDAERVYTEKEIDIVKKIDSAELIPYKHIRDNKTDKTKLSLNFAMELNKLLTAYEKAEGDNKLDILSDENYTEIHEILNKKSLTEEDIKKLKEIYTASVESYTEE